MASEEKSLPPTADAVEEQLARILASHDFVGSVRLSAFLDFVVRKTLAGKGDEIKEYAVGTEVFDRPSSFDPRLDTIVRVQASKLRSRLTEYYATIGANDPIVIELARGSYVPLFHTNGTFANGTGQESLAGPSAAAAVESVQRERRTWLIVALCGIGLIVLAALYGVRPIHAPVRPEPIRFTLAPPENAVFSGAPDISPDGRRVITRINTSQGSNALWLRSLDVVSDQILPGTEGAGAVSDWSVDGRFALFPGPSNRFTKIDVTAATLPQVIPGPTLGFGASWNRDDVIVFSHKEGSGLERMAATGGTSSTITSLDDAHQEVAHYWPQFLPDGRRFIYFARSRNPAENAIYAASLDGKVRKRLLTSESRAQYATLRQDSTSRPGYLLYVRQRTLLAHRFDPDKLELSGDPQPIVQGVAQYAYGMAAFSASTTGVLVYRSVIGDGAELTWFDRAGKQVGTIPTPGPFGNPAISPDGKFVAFNADDGSNPEIWTADLATGHTRRLTFDHEVDHTPVWSPDGNRIAFDSHRGGLGELYVKALGGVSPESRLLPWNEALGPDDWSRDGKFLTVTSWSRTRNRDVWILPLQHGHKPFQYLQTKSDEYLARFSPDGKWIAYMSDQTGKEEIYVQAFDGASPASGGKWLISLSGGSQPVWRANGTELFYLAPDNKIMAADVTTKATFTAGRPKVLFAIAALSRRGNRNDYDVSPDGQRFLVRIVWRRNPPDPINVFVNWAAALKD